MSKPQIYGHPLSPPTKIVQGIAKHLNLPYDFVLIDIFAGAQHKEPFSKLTPQHKVPVYQEGSFVLAESMAIAKYLCDRGEGTSLYPRDPRTRATLDMHIGILDDLRMAQLKLDVLEILEPKIQKKEPNTALIKMTWAAVKKILAEYEALFKEDPSREYVLLGHLTILDFVLAQQLIAFEIVKYDYAAEYPGL